MKKVLWEGTTFMGSTLHFRIVVDMDNYSVRVEQLRTDAMGEDYWGPVSDEVMLSVLSYYVWMRGKE